MPGFPPPCVEVGACPFNDWVTLAAVLAYTLAAETAILALSLLYARLRQRGRLRRSTLALAAVGMCALLAIPLLAWLTRLNPHYLLGDIRMTPAVRELACTVLESDQARMLAPMGSVATVFIVGTVVTALSLFTSGFRRLQLNPQEPS